VHILSTKQAQFIQWTQGLFTPFSSCHFPSNTTYSVLILYARGGQPVRDQQPHFLLLPQRATSYTLAHINITSSLPHWNTYLCSVRLVTRTILTSQLLIFILFSGTSSNYVRAAWNRAKSRMRLAI